MKRISIIKFSLLIFFICNNLQLIWSQDKDSNITEKFIISRESLSLEEKELLREEINGINKLIPVESNTSSLKTWEVYTTPILKRKNLYLVRTLSGEIAGYAAMRDEGNYLSWIAIKNKFRGKENGSLAQKLMATILLDYEKIVLDVRKSNQQAVKFYQSLEEISCVESRPGEPYKNGEEGVIFSIGPKL